MGTPSTPLGAPAIRCSQVSLDAGEDLAGSAPGDARWLLLEQPGPWGREALLESDLDPSIARPLHERTQALGIRVGLLRRDAARAADPDAPRTCFLASTERGDAWLERHVLPAPADVLALDLDALAAGERTDPAAAWDRPVLTVCAHGRRDACCSLLGRPVQRALSAHWPDETWQCSHTGGHRFAPTFIAYPHGACFGRVDPDAAPGVVSDLAAGRLDLDRLRGRCGDAPLVQAADVLARRALGLDGVDALAPTGVEPRGPDEAVVTLTAPDGGAHAAHVRRVPTGAPRIQSCAKPDAVDPGRLELVALRPAG